jgi:hypothetical protein
LKPCAPAAGKKMEQPFAGLKNGHRHGCVLMHDCSPSAQVGQKGVIEEERVLRSS